MSILKKMMHELSVGNEAISYQDGTLHDKITREIDRLRQQYLSGNKKAINTDIFADSELDGIVKKSTGLDVTFHMDDTVDISAYVYVPRTNKNSTLNNGKSLFYGIDIEKALRDNEILKSEVDLKNAKVSGFFSKIGFPIAITKGLFVSKDFTSNEISSIILHELGHAFVFLAEMARTAKKNYIIESHVKDFAGLNDKTKRIDIVHKMKAKKLLNKDFDETTILECKDKDAALIVYSNAHKYNMEDPSSFFHNMTQFESAADQFAVRMGAGAELTTALNKIYKIHYGGFWATFYYWRFQYASVQSLLISISMWFALPFILVSVGVSMLFVVPFLATLFFTDYYQMIISSLFGGIGRTYQIETSSYDKPEERIKRIRNEVVGELKKINLPTHKKKGILDILDNIDEVNKENAKYRVSYETLETVFWGNMIEFFKVNRKTRTEQQQLEELINNKLYEHSARFDTI